MKKAVVLLSGGLDSATVLYFAKSKGFKCSCLIFDYGQLHRRELESAKRVARSAGCSYEILKINFPWKGSSLLDKKIKFTKPLSRQVTNKIPNTYVPGRNIIFLSFAVSYAEAISARAIFIGAHAEDYSGYPDCRKEFLNAFAKAVKRGTKAGVMGKGIKIEAPLVNKTKAQIIRLGESLKVSFGDTWSCYRGGNKPCGNCDSCFYRSKGFKEAGLLDPLIK